jgi:hypothetical protein
MERIASAGGTSAAAPAGSAPQKRTKSVPNKVQRTLCRTGTHEKEFCGITSVAVNQPAMRATWKTLYNVPAAIPVRRTQMDGMVVFSTTSGHDNAETELCGLRI